MELQFDVSSKMLNDQQVVREGQMIHNGIERHQGRQLKQQQSGASNVDQTIIEDALGKVSRGITSYLETELAKGAGKPYKWVDSLKDIDPDVLAYMGLTCFMSAVAEEASLTTCTAAIARRIELEVYRADLEKYDKKLARKVTKLAVKNHSTQRKRLDAIKSMVAKAAVDPIKGKFIPQKLELSIKRYAEPVANAVLEFSGIFEIYVIFSLNRTKKHIGFTPEAAETMRLPNREATWKHPMFAPMICKPTPWSSPDDGGYLDRSMANLVPLVRGACYEQRVHLLHDFEKGRKEGRVPPYVEALNALQAVPLRINRKVLELVEHCWGSGAVFKKFPQKNHLEMTASPTQAEWALLTPLEQQLHTIQRKAKSTKNREIDGRLALMDQDLYTAKDLVDFPEIFLVWNMDFRGRFYPVSNFSYHRDDHIKAMFLLANGSVLTDDNCEWLAIHVANTGDFGKISKASLEDRVIWVQYNEGMLRKVANDPVAMLETIKAADKPFQFYAACVEWVNFLEHGDGYVCGLPPFLDGSNSGCQHYSALSLNEVDGALVNLVPSDKPLDVYQSVSDKVNFKLRLLSAAVGGKGSAERKHSADLWLKYGVTRAEVKRNAMTFAYASNQYGFADQIKSDIMKPLADAQLVSGAEHPFGGTESQFKATTLFAELSYASVQEVIASASQGMEFIQSVTVALARENKPAMWRSPIDFPVVQKYMKWNAKKIRLYLYDRDAKAMKRGQMTIRRQDGFKICPAKTKSSSAANYIHSLDAAHLASTILALTDIGIKDFMVIHDAFGVTVENTWDLFDVVRQTFVEQYSGECLYSTLKASIEQQLSDPESVEFKPIPSKGALSLDMILRSDYCFS